MESYIPLVKAIIITTMFPWGHSSVVITNQYILKEINWADDSGYEEKEYQVFVMKNKDIHFIDQNMQRLDSSHIIYLDKYKIQGIGSDYNDTVKTTLRKRDFGGFRCKEETIDVVEHGYIKPWESNEVSANPYSIISYFAKIPWMDATLNTKEKREFAGFDRQEFNPYHYLIHEFVQYPDMSPQDNVLRIIEKTEVDTTLIHTLLSLPIRKDR